VRRTSDGREAAFAHDVGARDFCAENGGVDANDGDVVNQAVVREVAF